MKPIILFFILSVQLLLGEPSVLTDQTVNEPVTTEQAPPAAEESSGIGTLFNDAAPSALTLEFSNTPSRAYVGEIIPVTVKLTPANLASGNVEYTLQNDEGIRIFSETPQRSVKDDGVYDTFYFLVISGEARLPDITATLSATGETSQTLSGLTVEGKTLTPPSTYANVLADSLDIVNYKTTPYNNESNIVIFTVKAKRCNIGDFRIPNAIKQGFESKFPNVGESQMTYYAIIPATEQSLGFSYFNLKKQRYESLAIPIVVDEDMVSTQSDIAPTDSRHTELKVTASLITILVLAGMFYWRRNKWYLYLSALPVFYLVFVFLPNEDICIKKNSPIYLLPINHGTTFEVTDKEEHFEAEKEVGDFTKIHLDKNRVGWVHKRDFCSN